MGRRYYKRRGRQREQEPSLADIAAEGIASFLGWLLSLPLHLVLWIFRRKIAVRDARALEPVRTQPLPPEIAAKHRAEAPAGRRTEAALPYRRVPRLITKGEWAFYLPLRMAVKGRYRVFPKVRLADAIGCPDDHPDKRAWWSLIRGYHLDFVICGWKTTAPLLVVELDDRGHRGARQRDRDSFKDKALRAAGIPIMRVKSQQAYDPTELAKEIAHLINPYASEQKT